MKGEWTAAREMAVLNCALGRVYVSLNLEHTVLWECVFSSG